MAYLAHELTKLLANKKQRTVLDGRTSKWGAIEAGVLQGYIFGPLFFLIYINDLTGGLKSNVKLFTLLTTDQF